MPLKLVVFVPTYKRLERLRLTLDSLKTLGGRTEFLVLVADNDANTDTVLETVKRISEQEWLPGRLFCIRAPLKGLSNCRNAGLKYAFDDLQADAVAMLDDDSVAVDGWLDELVATHFEFKSSLTGGPTRYLFPSGTAEHITMSPLFSKPFDRSGLVPILRSANNCLISRPVYEKMGSKIFDSAFNFSGGEDTDFFARCSDAGFTFGWSNEAVIVEPLPAERCTTRWMLKRIYMSAANSARVDIRRNGKLVAVFVQSIYAVKELLSGVLRLASLSKTVRTVGLLRLWGAAGRLGAMFGRQPLHG